MNTFRTYQNDPVPVNCILSPIPLSPFIIWSESTNIPQVALEISDCVLVQNSHPNTAGAPSTFFTYTLPSSLKREVCMSVPHPAFSSYGMLLKTKSKQQVIFSSCILSVHRKKEWLCFHVIIAWKTKQKPTLESITLSHPIYLQKVSVFYTETAIFNESLFKELYFILITAGLGTAANWTSMNRSNAADTSY